MYNEKDFPGPGRRSLDLNGGDPVLIDTAPSADRPTKEQMVALSALTEVIKRGGDK